MRRFIMSTLVSAAVMASAQVAAFSAPPMWQVSDADNDVWLFGSIHALPEGADWRTPLLDKVLQEADLYYYEAPLNPEGQAEIQSAVRQYGLNPPGERLTSYLTVEQSTLLRTLAQSYGVPIDNLEVMRPWLAGLTLSVGAMQQQGFSMATGVELTLQPETPDARERYFETPGQQLRFFADLPHDVQVATLVETLNQLTDQTQLFQALFTAWQTGDVEGLEKVLQTLEMEDLPEVRQAIIVDRNRSWATDIEDLMASDKDVLIIVGAGHLVGDDAVQDLLAQRGFKVERIQ